MNMPGLL